MQFEAEYPEIVGVGNQGMCRMIASLDIVQDDVPSTEQNLQQAQGLLRDYGPG